MRVFISWSGHRSGKIGDAFKRLLVDVFPAMEEPFFSVGIPGGTVWREQLESSLAGCDAIVFCFTPEAATSDWVLYEAGYMAARGAPIFPFVYGAQVPDPLGHLQAVEINRETVWDFISRLETRQVPETVKRSPEDLSRSFLRCWPAFDEAIRSVVLVPVSEFVPEERFVKLFDRKTFSESFPDCIDGRWLERYDAVARTRQSLDDEETRQALSTDAYVSTAFRELTRQLDRYQMLITGSLLNEVAWDAVPDDEQRRLEMCRQDILRLVRDFDKPSHLPLLQESIGYAAADTEARNDTIHDLEIRLENGEVDLEILTRGTKSSWDLDRVVTYVAWQQGKLPSTLGERAVAIRREEERARTRGLTHGLQPLYYALQTFDDLLDGDLDRDLAKHGPAILESIGGIDHFINERSDRDTGGHIGRRVDSIASKVHAALETGERSNRG